MPNSLIFQPTMGASGDMILGALIDILGNEEEFIRLFEHLGLDVRIRAENVTVNHLNGKRVTVDVKGDSSLRHFPDIKRFLRSSPFSENVKDRALKIFENIFRAEAEVHGEILKNVMQERNRFIPFRKVRQQKAVEIKSFVQEAK